MLVATIVGVVVAALASGVSIWSVVTTRRMAQRQTELQERLLAVETNREEARARQTRSANVRAAIQRTGRDWRLIVMNEGPAPARNVRVELDGGPLTAHTLVPRGQDEVTMLGPGAHARYLLAPAMGKPMTVLARVTRDDDFGNGRVWESQLSL
ncbi:MAG: hypothetical protein HYS05_15480 [Acidobacteria bacterium]|nr:hypothetical protein [Acidobacteriota bacterium]